MCICLVAEDQTLQSLNLNTNFPVVAASIVDPYVALLTQNGRLILFLVTVSPNVQLQVALKTLFLFLKLKTKKGTKSVE